VFTDQTLLACSKYKIAGGIVTSRTATTASTGKFVPRLVSQILVSVSKSIILVAFTRWILGACVVLSTF
jgi:hypothetical protein